jgi:hypothetical protein
MKRLAVAIGLSIGLLFFAGPGAAQYRYTDDKGVSKVTQYKLDVPAPYRDGAVWIGATGTGRPALSDEQKQVEMKMDAQRRIDDANAALAPYLAAERAAQRAANGSASPEFSSAVATCQRAVNGLRVQGARTFKADAASNQTYGTDAARFEFEKCMARQ